MEERYFGEISGFPTGSVFKTRKELSEVGVHKPTQAGISGSQKYGADSIVLSGGYDDKDYGDYIIYTGHGGRDESTGAQAADQELTRQNLALVKSMEGGLPVRVIRGAEHVSPFSPKEGYRYDGLFVVEDYWKEELDSHWVWKFKLTKLGGEKPKVTTGVTELTQKLPGRRETVSMRIIRDTKKSQEVKKLYDYHCQVCGVRLEGPNGPYAEAAHIKPLGEPHNGPDTISNIICLCPNHHILFDIRAFKIGKDLKLIGLPGEIKMKQTHQLDESCLIYRIEHY